MEELIQVQPDPQKAGLVGHFRGTVDKLAFLADRRIQQEQDRAAQDTLVAVEECQRGAKDWHQKMLEKGAKYWLRRPTPNTTLNKNLELFSLYLDMLTLTKSFNWVSRCGRCLFSARSPMSFHLQPSSTLFDRRKPYDSESVCFKQQWV